MYFFTRNVRPVARSAPGNKRDERPVKPGVRRSNVNRPGSDSKQPARGVPPGRQQVKNEKESRPGRKKVGNMTDHRSRQIIAEI